MQYVEHAQQRRRKQHTRDLADDEPTLRYLKESTEATSTPPNVLALLEWVSNGEGRLRAPASNTCSHGCMQDHHARKALWGPGLDWLAHLSACKQVTRGCVQRSVPGWRQNEAVLRAVIDVAVYCSLRRAYIAMLVSVGPGWPEHASPAWFALLQAKLPSKIGKATNRAASH